MSAATYNIKKVAEYRQHIILLLLNNKDLVDNILGHPEDKIALSQHELLN